MASLLYKVNQKIPLAKVAWKTFFKFQKTQKIESFILRDRETEVEERAREREERKQEEKEIKGERKMKTERDR